MAVVVGPPPSTPGISGVGNANPVGISGVGNANPVGIRGVGVANPTGNVNVVPDYGLQGGQPLPYSPTPVSNLVPGGGGGGGSVVPNAGGGGGGRGGPTAAQVAAAAQAAKIASAIDNGQNTILATGMGSGQTAATDLTNQGNQIYGQLAQGQNNIDLARKNIGISQINSIKGLVNTIRQGLHGQAVNLGNSNALASSAADAVARAYANYGNVQENQINNEAGTKNEEQDVAQKNLGIQHDIGLSNLKAFRDDAVQKITTEAQVALDNLKQYVSIIGGDGNNVDIAGIKQQILDNAQNKLSAVDAFIQDKVGGVRAAAPDQTAADAYSASNAGVVPSGSGLPFQIDQTQPSTTPTDLGGAPNSLIPLALKPRQVTA